MSEHHFRREFGKRWAINLSLDLSNLSRPHFNLWPYDESRSLFSLRWEAGSCDPVWSVCLEAPYPTWLWYIIDSRERRKSAARVLGDERVRAASRREVRPRAVC